MKLQKMIPLLLSLCLLLTGCGAKYTTTEEAYVPEEDFQIAYLSSATNNPFTESETGYYFLVGNYIHYMDKETVQPMVLCQKPSCKHDKETDPYIVAECNAYASTKWLSYYNGKLYAVVDSTDLYGGDLLEISADGSERKKLFSFERKPEFFALHRGNLYYSGSYYDEDGKSVYSLNMLSLSSASKKEKVLYEGSFADGNIQDIWPYRNRIYFRDSGTENEKTYNEVMVYDCLTNEIGCLTEDVTLDGVTYSTSFLGFYQNDLLMRWNTVAEDGSYLRSYKWYSLETGEYSDAPFSAESNTMDYTDGIYLFRHDLFLDELYLTMYDENGSKLVKIPMESLGGYPANDVVAGNEYLFVTSYNGDTITAYDKAELVKGIVNPIPVLDVNISDYLKSVITILE